MKFRRSIFLLFLILVSCNSVPNLFGPSPIPPTPRPATEIAALPTVPEPAPTRARKSPTNVASPLPISPTATIPSASAADTLWISPAVPDALAEQVKAAGVNLASDSASALYSLDIAPGGGTDWVYALVAPFPTVTDEVTLDDIRNTWNGSPSGPFAGRPLRMAESTWAAFRALWGEPASGSVLTAPAERLLDDAWTARPAWAIIPFEEIQPKWKVLAVDGQSPIRKKFDALAYPLKIHFALTTLNVEHPTFNMPATNRDPSKLATVILTGVTALVRATARTMDVKGITYPGEDVRDIFREADILHINNEVPFYGGCPDPDLSQRKLQFCSATRYIGLLTDIGADVVELSGDHFADYGPEAVLETLDIYKNANMKIYGGGKNLSEGKKPLLLEVNGNKILFIGCNIKSIYANATEMKPGSVPCDFPYITSQIELYRAQGYLPIATFQYHEFPTPEARPQQMTDYRQLADSGAMIISGSQAHLPQVMEFYGDAFIHYGLGNLFFDQMGEKTSVSQTRLEFIDRHVFYDGKYLGVELLTALLEDYARPRPMNLAERIKLLTDYFSLSGW
jgi:poly-gamma-glutamate synthesis protein (capsule biosynthesis protein)